VVSIYSFETREINLEYGQSYGGGVGMTIQDRGRCCRKENRINWVAFAERQKQSHKSPGTTAAKKPKA